MTGSLNVQLVPRKEGQTIQLMITMLFTLSQHDDTNDDSDIIRISFG